MTPTDFNRLKAEQRATYEMAKLIKKRYRATGTGATPQQIVDGKKYLPYTKYTKIWRLYTYVMLKTHNYTR